MQGDPTTPYLFSATDYLGRAISIQFVWGLLTGLLLVATATRDQDCMFRVVYVGSGADGTPNSAAAQFPIPFGTTSISVPLLNGGGLYTKSDLLAKQITAGP